ncbi:hypothetical protein M8J75_003396 [Diaphorina citri]|nr:hypothetical protein M8J75_003396 [Diaphorina citri]
MGDQATAAEVNEEDFQKLKERMKMISDADPLQYHNDFSLKRYLRAFKQVDPAFQAILKTNKWRVEYDVASLTDQNPIIKSHLEKNKARVLKHRDMNGRPVIYIPARNHNANDRDIDEITKFIEEACKKCFEEVVDNLCIVFDLKDFGLSCMDYQMIKNLIWLLSRHYPERLGVLDEKTSSKVTFVYNEMDLCKYLIPDILPDDM